MRLQTETKEVGVTRDAKTDRQEDRNLERGGERERDNPRLAGPEEKDHTEGKRQTY